MIDDFESYGELCLFKTFFYGHLHHVQISAWNVGSQEIKRGRLFEDFLQVLVSEVDEMCKPTEIFVVLRYLFFVILHVVGLDTVMANLKGWRFYVTAATDREGFCRFCHLTYRIRTNLFVELF